MWNREYYFDNLIKEYQPKVFVEWYYELAVLLHLRYINKNHIYCLKIDKIYQLFFCSYLTQYISYPKTSKFNKAFKFSMISSYYSYNIYDIMFF